MKRDIRQSRHVVTNEEIVLVGARIARAASPHRDSDRKVDYLRLDRRARHERKHENETQRSNPPSKIRQLFCKEPGIHPSPLFSLNGFLRPLDACSRE